MRLKLAAAWRRRDAVMPYAALAGLCIGLAMTNHASWSSFYGAIVGGFGLGLAFATVVNRWCRTHRHHPSGGSQ